MRARQKVWVARVRGAGIAIVFAWCEVRNVDAGRLPCAVVRESPCAILEHMHENAIVVRARVAIITIRMVERIVVDTSLELVAGIERARVVVIARHWGIDTASTLDTEVVRAGVAVIAFIAFLCVDLDVRSTHHAHTKEQPEENTHLVCHRHHSSPFFLSLLFPLSMASSLS